MNEAPPRRITRSGDDRVVAGVCGGLADYTGVDPVVFRVVFAVAALLGGAGLAAYATAWLLIPDEGGESHVESLLRDRDIPRIVVIALGVVALVAMARLVGGRPTHLFGGGFSLVVLLVVALWLWHRQDGRAPRQPKDPPTPRPRRERSRLGALTVSTAFVVAGALAALRVDTAAVLAACLLVVGLGLLVGSGWGRARLLIPLGLVLAVAAGVAAVADVPFRGGAGDRTWRPVSAADLRDEYRLGAGQLQLDLRGLDLAGATRQVTVRLGAGHVAIWLPVSTGVHVDGHIGGGLIVGIGDDQDGVDVTRHLDLPGDRGRLVLDVRVGLGLLEVKP